VLVVLDDENGSQLESSKRELLEIRPQLQVSRRNV